MPQKRLVHLKSGRLWSPESQVRVDVKLKAAERP